MKFDMTAPDSPRVQGEGHLARAGPARERILGTHKP